MIEIEQIAILKNIERLRELRRAKKQVAQRIPPYHRPLASGRSQNA
ncbi:hypothetical protein [Bradyrhizobium cenepequi]|nr:hypothetical protein [Bradyrhizobium cenepequi]MCA6108577.1 hypothetical protein [Bradyrhizobium cenepequi]